MSARDSFVDEDHKRTKSKNILIDLAPGPGNYRLPSDFGQYDEIQMNNSMMVRSTARSRFIK